MRFSRDDRVRRFRTESPASPCCPAFQPFGCCCWEQLPDGAARHGRFFGESVGHVFAGADHAVPDGIAYRLAGDLLRHDGRRGGGRRLHPADVQGRGPGDLEAFTETAPELQRN